jgi:hypothetical protein
LNPAPLAGSTSFAYQKSHQQESYQAPASKFTKTYCLLRITISQMEQQIYEIAEETPQNTSNVTQQESVQS